MKYSDCFYPGKFVWADIFFLSNTLLYGNIQGLTITLLVTISPLRSPGWKTKLSGQLTFSPRALRLSRKRGQKSLKSGRSIFFRLSLVLASTLTYNWVTGTRLLGMTENMEEEDKNGPVWVWESNKKGSTKLKEPLKKWEQKEKNKSQLTMFFLNVISALHTSKKTQKTIECISVRSLKRAVVFFQYFCWTQICCSAPLSVPFFSHLDSITHI